MKTKFETIKIGQWFISLVAASLVLGVTAAPVQAHPDSVSGQAFGASVDAAGTTVGPAPLATIPSGGGMTAAEASSLSVPNVLGTDTLRAIATGGIGDTTTSATSLATVENINILNGLITAKLVVPISSSTGDGITATSNSAGSALVDLVVNGVPLGDVTPAPNTTIDIPGVGTLILNEQVQGGDGMGTSGLTLNMLHLILKDAVTGATIGDIAVGSAKSGVFTFPFVPAHLIPPAGCVFYTGGGRIDGNPMQNNQDFGTFGFNATTRNNANGCGPAGQLQYHDHNPNSLVNVHGISANIDGEDGTCALFSGQARVKRRGVPVVGPNADGTWDYSARACDFGEPGVGRDTFNIVVPGLYDSTCGPPSEACGNKHIVLKGGNIQRHSR